MVRKRPLQAEVSLSIYKQKKQTNEVNVNNKFYFKFYINQKYLFSFYTSSIIKSNEGAINRAHQDLF